MDTLLTGDLFEHVKTLRQKLSIVYTFGDVENTPYKKGYIGSREGISFITLNIADGSSVYLYGNIFYIPIGSNDKIFITKCSRSVWDDWRIITTQPAAADEPGDDNEVI